MRAFYMILYGCFGDLVTVYDKVNNIKVLRGNENDFDWPCVGLDNSRQIPSKTCYKFQQLWMRCIFSFENSL